MKIATFSVNGIRGRLSHLLTWLEREQPNIACLQELNAAHDAFPAAAFDEAGYASVWHGQRSWNGVALLARGTKITQLRNRLPGDPSDDQSRYLEVTIGRLIVCCLYLANGNPQPGPKFEYKLRNR
jgi:exodeoxyribonuclease-3